MGSDKPRVSDEELARAIGCGLAYEDPEPVYLDLRDCRAKYNALRDAVSGLIEAHSLDSCEVGWGGKEMMIEQETGKLFSVFKDDEGGGCNG